MSTDPARHGAGVVSGGLFAELTPGFGNPLLKNSAAISANDRRVTVAGALGTGRWLTRAGSQTPAPGSAG